MKAWFGTSPSAEVTEDEVLEAAMSIAGGQPPFRAE
jgi:hypothetical protein